MKSTSAVALASVLLFSTGAFAQTSTNSSSGPNMQTTRDGVTPTPDASPTTHPDSSMQNKRQDKKSQHKRSSDKRTGGSTSGTTAPNMNTTPDGVTPTPDATPTVR